MTTKKPKPKARLRDVPLLTRLVFAFSAILTSGLVQVVSEHLVWDSTR